MKDACWGLAYHYAKLEGKTYDDYDYPQWELLLSLAQNELNEFPEDIPFWVEQLEATMTDWDVHNDEYKINYRWEYDLKDFPESVKINEYVNDQLREIMDVREDVVRKAAVEILRARGYMVIEPPKPSGHVHEKWMPRESARGGKYCAACGEGVDGN